MSFRWRLSIIAAASMIAFLTVALFAILCPITRQGSVLKMKKIIIISSASELEDIPVDDEGAVGPESLAFDPSGDGPYAGLSDGRIVKWDGNRRRWTDFAFTSPNRRVREECDKKPRDHEQTEHVCGRPLGLRFHVDTGDLYIADAYLGLLFVGPNGGLAQKVPAQQEESGAPFRFANGLDIDQSNGLVYFTDSSTRFPRRNYLSGIISGDSTGRLLRYDMKSKQVSVLVHNLKFPNGVSLAKDNRSVLVAESTTCRLLRYDTINGQLEVFADLPGFPDNIKRVDDVGYYYWVGIYSRRTRVSDWAISRPWIGEALAVHPVGMKLVSAFVRWRASGVAVRVSEEGKLVELLEDRTGKLKFISEVEERNGTLMFGSVVRPSVTVYNTFN